MECQPRALFPLLIWKICRRSPHHPLPGARIIPPPEAATHLGSNKLGMILDFWNMVFLKAGHRYYLITSTTVFFFSRPKCLKFPDHNEFIILFLHYNLDWLFKVCHTFLTQGMLKHWELCSSLCFYGKLRMESVKIVDFPSNHWTNPEKSDLRSGGSQEDFKATFGL